MTVHMGLVVVQLAVTGLMVVVGLAVMGLVVVWLSVTGMCTRLLALRTVGYGTGRPLGLVAARCRRVRPGALGPGFVGPGLVDSRSARRLWTRPRPTRVVSGPLTGVFVPERVVCTGAGGGVGSGATAGRWGVWGLHAGHRLIMARARSRRSPLFSPPARTLA